MPEHVHLLACPSRNSSGVDALLRAIERPYTLRIKRLLQQTGGTLLQELMICQRPGVETFRFWQEGPRYDWNLGQPESVLASIDYLYLNPARRRLMETAIDWQWSSALVREVVVRQGRTGATTGQAASRIPWNIRTLTDTKKHCWASQQWHPCVGLTAVPVYLLLGSEPGHRVCLAPSRGSSVPSRDHSISAPVAGSGTKMIVADALRRNEK